MQFEHRQQPLVDALKSILVRAALHPSGEEEHNWVKQHGYGLNSYGLNSYGLHNWVKQQTSWLWGAMSRMPRHFNATTFLGMGSNDNAVPILVQ